MRSVEERVIERVAIQMRSKISEVNVGSNLVDDLEFDSLDSVELTLHLEEEFRIEISDADAEKMHTVGDCIRYIKEKLV